MDKRQDQGVASGPGCQPTASAAAASSRSGIPNAGVPRYGHRYASEDVWEELDSLRHKLRMIISHASGGALCEPGDVDRSVNDICVEISRHKNEVWRYAQEVALRDASGIEAAAADETQRGSAEGESPVAKPDAQPSLEPTP